MSESASTIERLQLPPPLRAPRLAMTSALLVLVGLLTFAVLMFDQHHPARVWSALLQGLMIPTWISAGAVCFIAMNSIGGARWVVPLRRIMEGLSGGFVLTLVGFLLLWFFGFALLYEWGGNRQSLFHIHGGSKEHWMTAPRVLVTGVIAILLWLALRGRLVALSLRQDQRLDTTASHVRWSVVFLLIFAVTFTLFMDDTLLGLQARFISTTWGFYCFVSCLQTFLAVLCVVVAWLARGPLKEVVKPHLAHDLGTWTVAWSCIWAYIAYTQYIIIYFANTNEESYFYLQRMQHGYGHGLLLEILLRFPVPFLILMSQRHRNNLTSLAWVSALILLGCWIDLWWIIMPAMLPNEFHGFWCIPEVLIGAGFVGAFLLIALRFWHRHGLIPRGDPRLLSAINAEHLH